MERTHLTVVDDPRVDERLGGWRARVETGLVEPEPVALTAGRVLVVDDDPAARCSVALTLSEAGYDVRDVGSAWEARHALHDDTFDLLLSDVSMPAETGLDLIRFALCEHPETATLLISALDDPGIAQVAMDYGAYGYFSKPVSRSALLIGVMNALRRREMERRERAARDGLTGALSHALQELETAAEQDRALQAVTIQRWARAAEYRDPGVGRHVKRMSHYCAILGQRLGLQPESLQLASVLHDVGKIGIPERILLKPGPLTADERLAIETHASIGHEMLRDSGSSVLDLAAVIAWTHHEKFDGTGYPCGLAGAEIPIEGRIAAVADVFDAMTCDRVYRPAWTVKQAVAWMRFERGKHFDPRVLDAFLLSIDDVLAARSLVTARA
jgi:putative two-component system response regulator